MTTEGEPMTEQERPRTEAGPIARLRRMMERVSGSDRWDPFIDAAVEAARTEGRQQAVREIRAEAGLDEGWEFRPHGMTDGATINPFDLDAILDRVAGLNASESPRTLNDVRRMRDASESGQPSVALDPISGLPEHVVGPIAGEIAGQPPEASDE